jgi:hypothetical protein
MAILAGILAFSSPVVLAGGWAVSTLDELPSEFRAGQTYRIGYTIRQHGLTPYATSQTAIVIRSAASADTRRFAAVADGATGHYLAPVEFPTAGEWRWEVEQGPFAPQPLGSIQVLPSLPPAPTAEPAPTSVAETGAGMVPIRVSAPTTDGLIALRLCLLVAGLLASGVFVWQLRVYRRSRPAS